MIQLPIEKDVLESVAPHKSPMLLLDRIVNFDLDSFSCESEVFITPESMFFKPDDNIVPIWICFEYMAQTIAALSGISSVMKHEEPKVGFIMAVRDFKPSSRGFVHGTCVSIKVKQIFREGLVVAFSCTAAVDGLLVAEGIINAIEPDDELLQQMTGSD